MKLIDSHCHLDFSQFALDHKQVVQAAQQVGVEQFVIPGVEASQWQSLIKFCQDNVGCHYALGLHPYFLHRFHQTDLDMLVELLTQTQAIAVGECGIDSSIEDLPLQQYVFEQQIDIANQFAKPLIVHHRKSHHLIMQSLKKVKPEYGGVIHAFSGSLQDAQKYLELGFKLGVGGTITYDRAKKTRDVIAQVPLQSLVIETDSPDMPLSGKQGQRNEPKYIPEVLASLAQLKDLEQNEVAKQIYINTKQLFCL